MDKHLCLGNSKPFSMFAIKGVFDGAMIEEAGLAYGWGEMTKNVVQFANEL